jgi:neurofibromin 1
MTVHALHIRTKLCQLVEAMMTRRDDLAFRQEMKFRNKLVEYLTDWVMGTSHQIAPVTYILLHYCYARIVNVFNRII